LPVFSIFAGFTAWMVFDSVFKEIPNWARSSIVLVMVLALGLIFYSDCSEMVDFYSGQSGDGELIAYIENNSSPQDTVLMWGAETAFNFYTRRASPTRFSYQYALYSGYGGKSYVTEFLDDILTNRPHLIILRKGDKLSDFRFANRDNQVGALMDQIKGLYPQTAQIGDRWQIYTYSGQ
jgi:hypothetical protein